MVTNSDNAIFQSPRMKRWVGGGGFRGRWGVWDGGGKEAILGAPQLASFGKFTLKAKQRVALRSEA